MNIATYPSYHKTGVEWLGDIPAGWIVKRLKWSVEGSFNGVWGDEPDGIDDVVCLRVADFNRDNYTISTEALTLRAIEARQLESRKLKRGDLLIEKSGGGEKQLVGCVVYFDHEFDAVCSNFVARMPVAEGHLPRYWAYVHAGMYAGKLNYPAIKQTTGIQNLDAALYLDTLAAYPPLAEQQKIAAFLDWKTSQIDALIAKKQTLLQKLKEKRLAVITQAVTKGLNPDAPMRDSGIAWLGDVPAHWEVKRLKWAIMLQRGHDLPADERGQGDVPLVSSAGISAFHDVAIARAPGIVTGRYGTIGVFHLIEEDYWPLNTTLYSIDMFGNDPKFLRALLESLSPLFLLNSKKSAVPGVDRNDVHLIDVALPSVEEQNQIAAYISTEEVRHEQVTKNAESAITRLTEYRSALITAATTGKIDVRNVAIPALA
jgi:type I restriction enzyme S subunit